MAQLLILSSAADTDVLPALGLLNHRVRAIPAEPQPIATQPGACAAASSPLTARTARAISATAAW